MSELQINTTQNVKIKFTAAGAVERLLAFIIDNVIKIGYLIIMNLALVFLKTWIDGLKLD